jgi:formaldehyde-activating enzyme involved in methanogenesis
VPSDRQHDPQERPFRALDRSLSRHLPMLVVRRPALLVNPERLVVHGMRVQIR